MACRVCWFTWKVLSMWIPPPPPLHSLKSKCSLIIDDPPPSPPHKPTNIPLLTLCVYVHTCVFVCVCLVWKLQSHPLPTFFSWEMALYERVLLWFLSLFSFLSLFLSFFKQKKHRLTQSKDYTDSLCPRTETFQRLCVHWFDLPRSAPEGHTLC